MEVKLHLKIVKGSNLIIITKVYHLIIKISHLINKTSPSLTIKIKNLVRIINSGVVIIVEYKRRFFKKVNLEDDYFVCKYYSGNVCKFTLTLLLCKCIN